MPTVFAVRLGLLVEAAHDHKISERTILRRRSAVQQDLQAFVSRQSLRLLSSILLWFARSELDDNQIQQLFQQLIQRLIFYISMNSKQITTKLVVAVSSRMCVSLTVLRSACFQLGHLILNMMPDKWKNGTTAIISLFTQSQNEFLTNNVRAWTRAWHGQGNDCFSLCFAAR